jgi:hypothetical protein
MTSKKENLQVDQEEEFCSKCQVPKGQALYERYCEVSNTERPWEKLEDAEQLVWVTMACRPRKNKAKRVGL